MKIVFRFVRHVVFEIYIIVNVSVSLYNLLSWIKCRKFSVLVRADQCPLWVVNSSNSPKPSVRQLRHITLTILIITFLLSFRF